MTYEGTVKNGVVVFETAAPPDGTHVRVEAVATQPVQASTESIWDKLATLAGKAPDLPSDAALNHDHYLYGKPKR